MPQREVQRKLAAILHADVVGYSRLTNQDEEGTFHRLGECFESVRTLVEEHGGQVVNAVGDAVLADFATASSAVDCAVHIQRRLQQRDAELPEPRRLKLRVGVNMGEVIVGRDGIFGDGVNVAARLQAMADPGGICISESVRTALGGRLQLGLEPLGQLNLKNIEEPVWAHRVVLAPHESPAAPTTRTNRPAIAVLPFDNMSGDADQEYFADGVTEELITALSRIRWFFVIARNSTFTYRGRSVDVRQVARELGVDYVVEGSVRRSANRVRVGAQLIDGATGKNVWVDRYERDFDDVFAVQDELTTCIVGALEPELGKAERERALTKRPEHLGAWDAYQRGLWHLYRYTREDILEARRLFVRATSLDPRLGAAFSALAESYYFGLVYGHADDPQQDRMVALPAARTAVELDAGDAAAHCTLGRIHYLRREHDRAIRELETALALNPNLAWGHYGIGAALVFSGRAGLAAPHLQTAIRLSPRDPSMGSFLVRMADASLFQRDHEAAVDWALQALQQPAFQWSRHAVLASALGHLGRVDEARRVLDELRARRLDFCLDFVRATHLIADDDDLEHYLEGLRRAGLTD